MKTTPGSKREGIEMTEPLTENPVTPYTEASEEPRTSHENGMSRDNFQDHPSESYSSDEYDSDEEDEDQALSLSELLYSTNSFHAIVRPVSATMILAALSAVYINDQESIEMGAEQLASAYNYWDIDNSGDASNGKNLIASLGNALVMVTFIGTMTFGIVLLYKYRCMKFLIGYMVFSSGSLLGFLGDYMGEMAIEIYRIPIDKISWILFIVNFAIVGVTAIFYQKGIPESVTQAYLVFTSVILAWHLSHFDDWTAWSLLVMLAFYDLCAVLSPCGPLKALVNLMSEKDSPDMPGLLYEAQLPAGTSRPGAPTRSTHSNSTGRNSRPQEDHTAIQVPENEEESVSSEEDDATNAPRSLEIPPSVDQTESVVSNQEDGLRIHIPLALAKTYRLPLVSGYDSIPTVRRRARRSHRSRGERASSSTINASPLLAGMDQEEFYKTEFSTKDLLTEVEVEFSPDGGRIRRDGNDSKGRPVFMVYGRDKNLRRTLIVDKNGKVYEVANDDGDDDDESVYEHASSIRLGLGDFIFYSVMVAKAAMYSFTTFAACMLVILSGLGGTLVLLSVYHSALPALPISIFMGVIFYLLTKVLIEPWIEVIMTAPFYV